MLLITLNLWKLLGFNLRLNYLVICFFKFLFIKNKLDVHCDNGSNNGVINSFDERHYGDFDKNTIKEEFWINQFMDAKLKNENGESQEDVRNRFDNKINYLLEQSSSNIIAIVIHNACTLFYLLKYCKLINAQISKKLTISYNDKILIKDSIMDSPSIMKLEFEDKKLLDIEYIKI